MGSQSAITRTIEKTLPAVVSIIIKKSLEELKKDYAKKSGKRLDAAMAALFPKDKIDAHDMVQVDGGSGFFVDKEGVVLTNKHVISEPNSTYTVIANDGEEYPAEVIARDPVNDIAILKVKNRGIKTFPSLPLGDSTKLRLGEQVLTFGNALGLFENSVSLGIISGLSRSITAKTDQKRLQEMRGLIQTDAAINPGNSGGPLTDLKGNVIGINTAIIAGAQNICFAIPIHTAKRDLEELKAYGRVRRPMLGIHYLIVNKTLQEKMHLPLPYGAVVKREYAFEKAIHPGSPADRGGVEEGDLIAEWNGKKITEAKSVLDYLDASEVGDIATLTVLREGKTLSLKVTLAERK